MRCLQMADEYYDEVEGDVNIDQEDLGEYNQGDQDEDEGAYEQGEGDGEYNQGDQGDDQGECEQGDDGEYNQGDQGEEEGAYDQNDDEGDYQLGDEGEGDQGDDQQGEYDQGDDQQADDQQGENEDGSGSGQQQDWASLLGKGVGALAKVLQANDLDGEIKRINAMLQRKDVPLSVKRRLAGRRQQLTRTRDANMQDVAKKSVSLLDQGLSFLGIN
jgi:hypothetical protein